MRHLHLLKRFSVLDRKSFFGSVALAAAGYGLLYSKDSSEYCEKNTGISVSISVPKPLSDYFKGPWGTISEQVSHQTLLSSNRDELSHRILPLFFSGSSNVRKEPSTTTKDGSNYSYTGNGPKCSCNCLGRDTIANAAARVGPAVVNFSIPQGFHEISPPMGIGCGTIIDADGTILTCAHVVSFFQASSYFTKQKIGVTLQDGRMYEGTVVNIDRHSDIAIVKINSKTPLPTAKLGTSSQLRPGDWVLALGCPFTLQNTVTVGIVSSVDRKSSDLGLGGIRREYLQIDCAINEGNSGGPLVNVDGEIVGVNNMKVKGADGLAFAVPIDAVCKIIDHFKAKGRVVRPWLGLKMIDLNDMIVAHLKEKDAALPNVTKGVLVPMVTPGSPADRAGFHPGDVVVEFDGKRVGSIKEIIDIMGDKVGEPLVVVVIRAHDKSVTLTVTPEEANPEM